MGVFLDDSTAMWMSATEVREVPSKVNVNREGLVNITNIYIYLYIYVVSLVMILIHSIYKFADIMLGNM